MTVPFVRSRRCRRPRHMAAAVPAPYDWETEPDVGADDRIRRSLLSTLFEAFCLLCGYSLGGVAIFLVAWGWWPLAIPPGVLSLLLCTLTVACMHERCTP